MSIKAIHPNDYPITGGYPFLNISRWFQVPYSAVLQYADKCEEADKNQRVWPSPQILGPTGLACSAAIIAWTTIEMRRKAGLPL